MYLMCDFAFVLPSKIPTIQSAIPAWLTKQGKPQQYGRQHRLSLLKQHIL